MLTLGDIAPWVEILSLVKQILHARFVAMSQVDAVRREARDAQMISAAYPIVHHPIQSGHRRTMETDPLLTQSHTTGPRPEALCERAKPAL